MAGLLFILLVICTIEACKETTRSSYQNDKRHESHVPNTATSSKPWTYGQEVLTPLIFYAPPLLAMSKPLAPIYAHHHAPMMVSIFLANILLEISTPSI